MSKSNTESPFTSEEYRRLDAAFHEKFRKMFDVVIDQVCDEFGPQLRRKGDTEFQVGVIRNLLKRHSFHPLADKEIDEQVRARFKKKRGGHTTKRKEAQRRRS